MLGLAVALSSCSDDKYTVDQKLVGAYFAGSQSTTLAFSNETTSYTLKVYRTENSATSYTVTTTEPSGLFNVPTSVVFAADEYVTDLVITYDPAQCEEEKDYPMTIVLGDNVNIGRNALNFIVVVGPPLVTESFLSGKGTFYYNGYWSGEDPDAPITITYSPNYPNNVVWTIGSVGDPDLSEDEWFYMFYGINFNMTSSNYDPDQKKICDIAVPRQYTGYDHSSYGPLYVVDILTWEVELGNNPAPYQGLSYYDPATGLFNLATVYIIPEYGEGYYLGSAPFYEAFQMDGFPDLDVVVDYKGLFTERYGDMFAQATITTGSDVASAKAVMVAGESAQAGYDLIVAGDDSVIDVPVTGETTVQFPVTAGGTYTIVAVTYDAEGAEGMVAYDTFDITIGQMDDDSADWDSLGYADYVDGWATPGYGTSAGPLQAIDYAYSVEVQKYIGSEAVVGTAYRLINPYGDDCFLTQAGLNESRFANKRKVQFNVEDAAAGMIPQLCGFQDEQFDGEWLIGDMTGQYMEAYPGESVAALSAFVGANHGANYVTDYMDGMVIFNRPQFGSGDEFGYSWNNVQQAMIFLPDADATAVAKVKAAKVAAPKLTGLRKVTSSKQKMDATTIPGKNVKQTRLIIPSSDQSKVNILRRK